MHVLIAGTKGLDDHVERGLQWARGCGAAHVEVAATDAGVIGVASSGGPMAQIHRPEETSIASLGVDVIDDVNELLAGRIPGGTVAVAITARRLMIGSGEGNQRLFLASTPTGSLASTHVGALVAALGDVAIDRSYEDFLLGFGFLPDGRTPFESIRAMPRPGIVDLVDATSVDLQPPGSAPEPPSGRVDLAELVCDIVDEQAGAARIVGVLLGGFDSALVAAALNRTGREVHTFTFSFPESGYGQRNIDAAVAAAGAQHHWVPFTPEVLGDALGDLPARLNQPSPQPHYQLQTIIAAEAARAAGAQAIFTGDGCDALFAAYPTINTRAAATSSLTRFPSPVRREALRRLSVPWVERRLGHVARVGRSAVRSSMLDGVTGQHLPTQYLDDVALRRLRSGGTLAQTETVEEIRHRLAAASAATGAARLAVDGNALTGQSQSKVEGAVARTGLRVVSPFTHPRFRAAVASLPSDRQLPSGRLRGAEGKPVLQEAAERSGLLPAEVIYQKKQSPTEAPVDEWYAGPLRSTVLALLADLPFEVDRQYVDDILRPKRAEELYRNRVAISQHAFQAIGLLSSYAAFTRLAG